MTKPDWGHGPNPPVQMFSEEEIRLVLDIHYPTVDSQYGDYSLCACSTKVGLAGYTDFTTEHFIERLRKLREIAGEPDGRQEDQHQDTA